MIQNVARTAGTAALLLLFGAATARAQESDTPPPAPPGPLVHLYATGGVSLHQNPLSTHFAEVLGLDGRVGVPVALGIEPWIGGSLARLRSGCTEDVSCPTNEKRLLAGLIYQQGGGGDGRARGGPYFGAGLGTQSANGVNKIAYTIIIGLPFSTARLAPIVELRAERHQGLGDLLMISGGIKVGAGR